MSRMWESPEEVAQRTGNNDGRMCLVIDPEDGTHPTRIYGIDKDEILEKAARTVEHGQRAISALKANPTRPASGATLPIPGPSAAPSVPPPARVKPLTSEETMRLTEELQDPAKAGPAVKRLFEGTTGLNVDEMTRRATLERYAQIAGAWEQGHPEFPKHPANLKMLTNAAALKAGGLANVTAQILEQSYQELKAGGYLVEDYPTAREEEGESTLRPQETAAAVSVAPTRTATTYRRNSLRGIAPAAQPTRYTQQQIAAMSSAEILRRIENEPGFKEALDALASTRKTA